MAGLMAGPMAGPIVLAGLAASIAPSPAFAARAPVEGFADLSERLSPAVVNIRTSSNVDGGLPTFPPGSPLERFNEYLGGAPRTESSLGSGFVIDPEGIIVTNNHVIEGADAIEVVFQDGLTLDATVIGRDPATDLAVLRVSAGHDLPHVNFGDSDAARVGDWVVAIGNPFGLGNTLTVGVISARNRDISSGAYDDFIQTDASINRGNSGGPLFNLDGDVIGVNSAILSPSGGSVGIGFSIPSDLARTIVDQLMNFGETRRGWLGVGIQRVTSDLAESYGIGAARGAIVVRVTEGSPADEAGLEPGDLILSYNGQIVPDDRVLTRRVAETEVGREVAIEFLREDERRIVMVEIDRLDEGAASAAVRAEPPAASEGAVNTALGLTLAPLDAAARRRYGIADDAKGVIVTFVDAASDAASKVRVGDVIEEVAWESVATPQDASELADAAGEGGKPVLLLINRGGQLVFESVRPSS